jgi:hypothetical protein
MMKMNFLRLCGYTAFILVGLAAPAFGQQQQCFQLAQNGVRLEAWVTIRDYFASLSIGNDIRNERSRLLQLRGKIIDLESQKQKLIELIDSHLRNSVAGTIVSTQLRITDIPKILGNIDYISQELTDLSNAGSLFAAERAFKELKMNLDRKRASTLCELAQQTASQNPDWSKMTELVESLRSELKAISDAEEALGDYIKKMSG